MLARAFVEVQTVWQTCQHFLPGNVGMRMGFVIHPRHESQNDSLRPVTKLTPMRDSPAVPLVVPLSEGGSGARRPVRLDLLGICQPFPVSRGEADAARIVQRTVGQEPARVAARSISIWVIGGEQEPIRSDGGSGAPDRQD